MKVPRSPYGEGNVNGKEALGLYFGEKYGHKPGIWVSDPWGKNLEGTPFSDAQKRNVGTTRGKACCAALVYDFPATRFQPAGSMTLEDYFCRTYGVVETPSADRRLQSAGGFGLGPDALSAYLVYEWSKSFPPLTTAWRREFRCSPAEIPV